MPSVKINQTLFQKGQSQTDHSMKHRQVLSVTFVVFKNLQELWPSVQEKWATNRWGVKNQFFLKLPQELNLARAFADLQPSAMSNKKGLPSAMHSGKFRF